MKMKAVRFWAPNDIRYEEVEVPKLQEGEILVRVHAALTCGTDVKTFRRGHPVLIKKIPSGYRTNVLNRTVFVLYEWRR